MRGAIEVLASVLLFAAAAPRAHAAPADTLWGVADPPRPRAGYTTFAAARDSLKLLIKDLIAPYTYEASWSKGEVKYRYHDKLLLQRAAHGAPMWVLGDRDTVSRVPGFEMTVTVKTEKYPSDQDLRRRLEIAGWAADPGQDADGPDGTRFLYVSREAICDVEGSWDGGDASDSAYVRAPGITLHVTCVPRPPRNPEIAKHVH
jgi:hypothetical protein